MLWSQVTPFRGLGGYSSRAFSAKGTKERFPQAQLEAADFSSVPNCFKQVSLLDVVRGKDVLDLGSGNGGRTVEYARYARHVVGIEVFDRLVSMSRDYAAERGVENCEFMLCAEDIPLPDRSVDVIICYDVLEHVADPRETLKEMFRVLRPGVSPRWHSRHILVFYHIIWITYPFFRRCIGFFRPKHLLLL